MTTQDQVHPLEFFGLLNWLDGRPLPQVIEPYRARIFEQALYSFDGDGRPHYNLDLTGRAKKNWKSADMILAAFYRLLAWKSQSGNQCYILANDLDQSNDNLALAKKLVAVNPVIYDAVDVRQKIIERKDGAGFLEILPAGDVVGSHGKTYLFAGFDEIHGYRTWDLLEAMQLDPTRTDALMWITSYASIYHKPGVPLFDLLATGKKGQDPRMFFSWYAADYCTDPAMENLSPEGKANPSAASWEDQGYLEQQRGRLPSHKFNRLHLNLPGLPEGSAFTAEAIMDAIEREVRIRPPSETASYVAFVDMSGGSNDDAVLAIAHKDSDGRGVLDRLVDQGQRPPFDPRKAVERFVGVLKEYGISKVTGDRYAGNTFVSDFQGHGVKYTVAGKTKHELYEATEPRLNGSQVVLLDHPEMESQFLSLLWRGSRIDHPGSEHDDFANAAAGAIDLALSKPAGKTIEDYLRVPVIQQGKPEIIYKGMDDEQVLFLKEIRGELAPGAKVGEIINALYDQRTPVDWASLKPAERKAVKQALKTWARHFKIRGNRSMAQFFEEQLAEAEEVENGSTTVQGIMR